MDEVTCGRAVEGIQPRIRRLGIDLTAEQTELLERYCALIHRVNATMNLTALRSPEPIAEGLFLDSLTIALAVPERLRTSTEPVALVDVGAGAGVPGLPLKVAFPTWNVTLIESIGKKARFIETAVADLRLADVRVVSSRAEDVARSADLRDRADLCVARAVAALPTLLELCAPFVRPGGHVMLPKSGAIQAEVSAAEPAVRALGLVFDAVISVPSDLGLGDGRVIVRYTKLRPTPAAYPRRNGLPRSRPIGSVAPDGSAASARHNGSGDNEQPDRKRK